MNQWAFVIAAYAAAVTGTAGLLGWAYGTMRKAEAVADRLKRPE